MQSVFKWLAVLLQEASQVHRRVGREEKPTTKEEEEISEAAEEGRKVPKQRCQRHEGGKDQCVPQIVKESHLRTRPKEWTQILGSKVKKKKMPKQGREEEECQRASSSLRQP